MIYAAAAAAEEIAVDDHDDNDIGISSSSLSCGGVYMHPDCDVGFIWRKDDVLNEYSKHQSTATTTTKSVDNNKSQSHTSRTSSSFSCSTKFQQQQQQLWHHHYRRHQERNGFKKDARILGKETTKTLGGRVGD